MLQVSHNVKVTAFTSACAIAPSKRIGGSQQKRTRFLQMPFRKNKKRNRIVNVLDNISSEYTVESFAKICFGSGINASKIETKSVQSVTVFLIKIDRHNF